MKQLSMLVLAAALVAGQARVALVIGNDAYEAAPRLTNAVADSRLIASALRGAGFQVTAVENTTRESLDASVNGWINRLPSGAVAMVYYAGHGVEIGGANYLLPVDLRAEDEVQARNRSLNVRELVDRISLRGAAVQILVLDACRNNPFPAGRSIGGRGLAAMTAAGGSFVAFSTSPQEIAADTSVYAQHLAAAIGVQGLKIEDVFKRVGAEVQSATNRRQVPWVTSSLAAEFYFAGNAGGGSAVSSPASLNDEEVYWRQCEANKGAFCSIYLERYPQGRFAALARLIVAPAPPPAPPAMDAAQMEKEFVDGQARYHRKEYSGAFPILLRLANAGHAESMFYVGFMFYEGLSVRADRSQALGWYRKAADGGNVNAMHNLGVLYANGEGIPKDTAEAVYWYRKAADKGHLDATFNLGIAYANGVGVPKDPVEAVALYRKAAAEGYASAMFSLGVMYADGSGVPKNGVEAVAWYRKAAEKGNAGAMNNLGVMYENGDGVPQNDVEATAWIRKAADKGLVLAMRTLAARLDIGRGVAVDAAEAKLWRERADKAEGK